MSKVEKMHIAEIMEKTNLFLTLETLYTIWKKPSEDTRTSIRPTALKLLENEKFAYDLIEGDDEFRLYKFLIDHDSEIDKVNFIMALLRNYKDRIKNADKLHVDAEEMAGMLHGIREIKKLLKEIDKTFVYYNMSQNGDRISSLTILNTQDECMEKDRKSKNSNVERLLELKQEANFGNIIQFILPIDIQQIIAFDPEIGAEIRYMIDFNTVLRENRDKTKNAKEKSTLKELASQLPRSKFVEETIRAVETHIEEINMDKLLLCAIYRYLEAAKQGVVPRESLPALKKWIEIARKHIKKNVRINIYSDKFYTIVDYEKDLKRFVGKGDNISFLSDEDVKQLKDAVLKGEISLTALGKQNFDAIELETNELYKVLENNPNNYIFLLKHDEVKYSKDTILRDIINAKKCSLTLLQLLCEKTDITSQEICELFDRGIIGVNELKTLREQTGTIITNEILFEQYKKYKEHSGDKQDVRTQLERYALAYRNTELLGKNAEQIQEIGEEFIAEVGEKIEPSDLVPLYGLDVIPLKVAVDWGGENIIEELLESESLKPLDARHLRDEGLLNEKVLERLFQKCTQMSYSYQISLVYAVFNGQTPEEQKIRENLAQYYHIEEGFTAPSGNGTKTRTRGIKGNKDNEPKAKIKMRDPGAKYNLLASLDKDIKIEEGIIDGHIIFHYPNIDGGTVLIEKLHKITFNRENGLIEIKADNQSATYVLSEEDFIKMKTELIQEGRIDRTQLTQKWWVTRDPEHWLPHTGTKGWEEALKTRFLVNRENQRYSEEDLKIIEGLIAKSIESKQNER